MIVIVVIAAIIVVTLLATGYFSPGGGGGTTSTYLVTFTETGLPHGAKWCVTVSAGGKYCGTSASIKHQRPDGTYTYTSSTTKTGYTGTGGSFTVSGAPVAVPVAFTS